MIRSLGDALNTQTKRTGRLALREVAAVVAVVAALGAAPSAWSLSLGRLSVQSALGESLRAEIDVTSLTPDESANLRVRVAPPDAYRIAGVDYNAVLPSTAVSLQRRADGTPYLRITSDRSVQEPFVDVILELSWSSGRLLREYTLLFDPPSVARAPAAPATPAVVAAAPARPTKAELAASAAAEAAARAEAMKRLAPAPAAAESAEPAALAKAPVRRPAAPSPVPAPAANAAAGGGTEYQVKSGDTLSNVASKLQVEGISLDQMLVGLYQGNTQAFIGNNMNRLRSGAVLTVPSAQQLGSVDAREARRLVQVQSANFNAYRQRLAGAVPEQVKPVEPTRKSGGQVRTEVVESGAAGVAKPDRLQLDKPKTAGKGQTTTPEETVVKQRAEKEASSRVNELARNLDELKKLQAASGAAAAGTGKAAAAASGPAVVAKAPEKPAELASAPVVAASAPMVVAAASAKEPLPIVASAPAPAVVASAPAVVPVVPAASRPAMPMDTTPVEEPSLIDSLSENPMLLPGAGLILAILAGLGYYRLRGKNKDEAGVTSFLESRLQPDSFFGASGGQRVDTRDAAGTPSSMSYSLSQIDAIGDVDPVAEADVYLAYGRDLQAEEILKEAMRANPERLAIRTKLLEVYAKRRDTKGYELLAGELYGLTGGQGEDWLRAQELGRSIDPDNPLYEQGGQPHSGYASESGGGEMLGASTMPQSVVPSPSRFENSAIPDFDLGADTPSGSSASIDLDISVPGPMDSLPPVSSPLSTGHGAFGAAAAATAASAFGVAGMSSSLDVPADSGHSSLDFELHDLPEISEPITEAGDLQKIDMGGLSLDFDLQPTTSSGAMDAYPMLVDGEDADPLSRKIELAKEFLDFGDAESARDMLQEVIEKSDGDLRAKAQAMLDKLA
ncbi:FimV/HubP family polar landmark protein [Sphaerotilus montanus]|uniref:FimV/HubP family polar landmark protein n=1 Tax=Sphaerotilus montanus TaxID=522889 RepID=UPI003FA213E5